MSIIQRRVSRNVKLALYRMLRYSGVPMSVYTETGSGLNPETGRETVSRVYVHLRRCITFSVKQTTRFEYDLSFVAANKNFTYGGLFNVGDRVFILMSEHLPEDFSISVENTFIIFDNAKWDIAAFEKIDHDAGYIISARKTEGSSRKTEHLITVNQVLSVEQTIAGTL